MDTVLTGILWFLLLFFVVPLLLYLWAKMITLGVLTAIRRFRDRFRERDKHGD